MSSSARDIGDNVVAYINMDGVAGREFSAGGVPSLDKAIVDVTKTVQDPGGGSIYSAWTGDAAAPTVNRLGSGSDYTVFLDHLGASAMEVGYSTPSGEYHSAYDQTYQVEHFLDPGYLGHQAASRTSGVTALRLANADALPLRYSDYARAVDGYVAELQEIQRTKPGPRRSTWGRCATRPRRGARHRWRWRRAPRRSSATTRRRRGRCAGSTGR